MPLFHDNFDIYSVYISSTVLSSRYNIQVSGGAGGVLRKIISTAAENLRYIRLLSIRRRYVKFAIKEY